MVVSWHVLCSVYDVEYITIIHVHFSYVAINALPFYFAVGLVIELLQVPNYRYSKTRL